MMSNVACVIAFVALVNGIDGIHAQPTISKTLRQTRSNEDLEICVPGETKMEDCNKCFCIVDGSGWACTRRLCESAMKMKEYGIIDQPNQNNPLNQAVGEGIHTAPNNHGRRLDTRSIGGLQICVPGEMRKEDCNDCFCVADGSGWGCTKKGCLPAMEINIDDTIDQPSQDNPLNRAVRDVSFTCVPYSRFKMDCNWCTCTHDGKTAACTLMGCNTGTFYPFYPK